MATPLGLDPRKYVNQAEQPITDMAVFAAGCSLMIVRTKHCDERKPDTRTDKALRLKIVTKAAKNLLQSCD